MSRCIGVHHPMRMTYDLDTQDALAALYQADAWASELVDGPVSIDVAVREGCTRVTLLFADSGQCDAVLTHVASGFVRQGRDYVWRVGFGVPYLDGLLRVDVENGR